MLQGEVAGLIVDNISSKTLITNKQKIVKMKRFQKIEKNIPKHFVFFFLTF